MIAWNKRDIGQVISYLNENGKIKTAVISNVYEETPETVKVVDFPITLNSRIYLLGIIKDNDKKTLSNLKEIGDWHNIATVSKNEREELNRISSSKKRVLDYF